MKCKLSAYLTLNSLWILLFGAGFAVFFCAMPKFLDDFWYMAPLRGWFESQGIMYPENGGNIFAFGIPWESVFDTWTIHCRIDNIRIPNLLAPLFLILPKWVGSLCMSILLVWSVMLGFRIFDMDWRKARLLPLAILLWTFVPVWSDNFGSLVFQLNYIIPLWLSMLLLFMLSRRVTAMKTGRTDFVCTVLIALFLGLSHEGFALPLFAGIAAATIFNPSWRMKETVAVLVALAFGVTLLFCAPGMWIRLNDNSLVGTLGTGAHLYSFARSLKAVLVAHGILYLIDLFLIAVCIMRKSGKLNWPLVIVILTSGAVSVILHVIGASGPRSCFWMQCSSIVLAIYLVYKLITLKVRKYKICLSTLSALFLAVTFLHLICVDIYAFRCRRNFEAAFMKHLESRETSLFESEPYFTARPLILGNRPQAFNSQALMYVDWYCDGRSAPLKTWFEGNITLFPAQLQDVDKTAGRSVGNGIRLYEGCVFLPLETFLLSGYTINDCNVEVEVDYGSGFKPCSAIASVFISPKEGREYVWLDLDRTGNPLFRLSHERIRIIPKPSL